MHRYFLLSRFMILMGCLSPLFSEGAFAQKTIDTKKAVYSNVEPKQQIQMTHCLAEKLNGNYATLAKNNEFTLIELPISDLKSLALLADKFQCGRFINRSVAFKQLEKRTEKEKLARVFLLKTDKNAKQLRSKTTYEIQHEEEVNQALSKVNAAAIMDTLTHLVSYYNRSAYTKRGLEVAEWLKKEVDTLAFVHQRTDVDTYFVKTGDWYKQPSLLTVIGKDLKEPAIVLGAHMDTLGGRMPGAGDDGSGSSSLMEVTRVLLESNLAFKRPIYIIWYAAEELGLVGSQQVVKYFQKKSIPVKAVVQFDMTGFRNEASDPTLWIYQDYTDHALSNYLEKLIETYIKVPVGHSSCGYGCSDHASWMEKGIPAAFPCETSFEAHNPYIHSEKDTIDRLNVEHMANFSKLGLSFAIEQGID